MTMTKPNLVFTIKNFIIKVALHIIAIIFVIWISALCIVLSVGQIDQSGLGFFKAVNLAYFYINWLFSVFDKLPFASHNYLKIKLLASLFLPSTIFISIYIKFLKNITSWRYFTTSRTIYGDSHWASQEEVKKAGLRSKEGMLLGVDSEGYYISEGFQHAILFAPTGSGKGVGFVIPNLLFWTHSVVVHDIKLENYQLTSGWRKKQGQEVYVWEPANPNGITHCYNPLDWVSDKPGKMVDDVQKIANLLIQEKDFWNNEARTLFLGVALYIIADPNKIASFGEVVRTLRSDDFVYTIAVALDTMGGIMHPVAYMNLASFLQKADKERSGVISTLNSGLELWSNPLIDAATSRSDFNILDFKKKKTTIYVGLTPDNITRLQKLMQIFYQQATDFLCATIPDVKKEPYGVLFMMDEFPTLGKMEQFKSGIAYFRGYRVRLFLIIQDTQQLKGTYEDAGMNSFLSNATYRITFAANNYETADLISKLCGNTTEKQVSHSKPKFFDLNPSTRTMNVSDVQRALLLPQEVIQLPRDEQIMLIESCPPIKSQKIKYFSDKLFTKRLLPATFVPTQEPYDPNKFRVKKDTEGTENKTTDEAALQNAPEQEIIEDKAALKNEPEQEVIENEAALQNAPEQEILENEEAILNEPKKKILKNKRTPKNQSKKKISKNKKPIEKIDAVVTQKDKKIVNEKEKEYNFSQLNDET